MDDALCSFNSATGIAIYEHAPDCKRFMSFSNVGFQSSIRPVCAVYSAGPDGIRRPTPNQVGELEAPTMPRG
ncbi:hypothetical protein [Flexibacterium corallicola]|uniref:hypothetical protein n=1 Tax=Flexibacterium corallicola TaxID=3037259 RepID=UPI00286EE091|nr:hypothetical protein [Pseudovibrio sp. M1P-2-3]